MHWLLKVTLSFVFLALAACGREESPDREGVAPVDPGPAAGGPESDPPTAHPPTSHPPTSMPAKPEEGPGDEPAGWPALDEDPSLDEPPGSGDWCGTDLRRGSGLRLGWQGPGADGVWRRLTARPRSIEVDVAESMRMMREARERIEAAETPAEKAKAEADLVALRERPIVSWRGLETKSTQFGIEHDGVFYTSEAGESRTGFLARAKKTAAERVAKRKAPRVKKAAAK